MSWCGGLWILDHVGSVLCWGCGGRPEPVQDLALPECYRRNDALQWPIHSGWRRLVCTSPLLMHMWTKLVFLRSTMLADYVMSVCFGLQHMHLS